MSRLRYNNVIGTLGAQLGANATAITFTVALPSYVATIAAPDFLPIVLEPDTAAEEIVYLIAYTAGATTGTVQRSAEPNTAPASTIHANTSPWRHGPTAADFKSPASRGFARANFR